MENDPTKILQQKIEQSKEQPVPFANLGAQDEDSDGCDDLALVNKELSDEENKVDTNLKNISDSLTPVPYNKKHKSHTPNPRKKGPAGANSTSCYILGICGGPSSGMSTVAKSIKADLFKSGISSEIFTLLNFYKPIRGDLKKSRSRAGSLMEEENKEQVKKEIAAINEQVDFDDPQQVDFELLIQALNQMKKRESFYKPVYDRFFKVRLQSEEKVTPADVIIVEGGLLFCDEQLRKMFDLSVFIDTDDDVRLSRRVLKNAQREEATRTELTSLLNTYETKTKPAFEKFIEPTKKYANIIIPNYGFSPDNFGLDKMTIQGLNTIVTDVKAQVGK